MSFKTPAARAFPLVLVAFVVTAACGGGQDEGPKGGAGGSSGSSNAGSGGKAGATGGSAGTSGGKGGTSSGGSSGSGNPGGGGKAGSSSGGSSQAGEGGEGGSAGDELCADRTGGALIEFGVVEETITVWIEDEAFITEAQRLLAADETRVPVFNTLIDGTDCDTQYTWHPDPNDVEFADFTIELCDAVPSYIEENKQEWLEVPGQWCPWSAVVVSVTER